MVGAAVVEEERREVVESALRHGLLAETVEYGSEAQMWKYAALGPARA